MLMTNVWYLFQIVCVRQGGQPVCKIQVLSKQLQVRDFYTIVLNERDIGLFQANANALVSAIERVEAAYNLPPSQPATRERTINVHRWVLFDHTKNTISKHSSFWFFDHSTALREGTIERSAEESANKSTYSVRIWSRTIPAPSFNEVYEESLVHLLYDAVSYNMTQLCEPCKKADESDEDGEELGRHSCKWSGNDECVGAMLDAGPIIQKGDVDVLASKTVSFFQDKCRNTEAPRDFANVYARCCARLRDENGCQPAYSALFESLEDLEGEAGNEALDLYNMI